MKFSVTTSLYNEETRVVTALQQFKNYTDDYVIFDTESTDSTNKLAHQFADKVTIVPYVGTVDCYMEEIQWQAKYDWCLWSSADEIWDVSILDWLRDMPEDFDAKIIRFKRKEILDGKVTDENSGYHPRFYLKGAIRFIDLMDYDCHETHRFLDCNEGFIHHCQSKEEVELGNICRLRSAKLLVEKYQYTKLEPYVSHLKSYKEYIKKYE